MFDIGFSEILLIFVIALVVLGPEKLPRVASQVGRWIGRARAMARQFKEQLEEEVNLEQVRKAHQDTPAKPATPAESPPPTEEHPEGQQPQALAAESPHAPDPVDFRAETFSHASPPPAPEAPTSHPPAALPPDSSHQATAPETAAEAWVDKAQRVEGTEAYAPAATPHPVPLPGAAADATTRSAMHSDNPGNPGNPGHS